ncbi:DUF397 domain-containing protein [Streptomyces somaliensis]|uniref:DUF397 domain-containing protein n=1 Tax=Streptomyces TaxID=1883 RepID=UPI0020274A8A|nr:MULTISPECIES: DUF397 domain-containing protein [Streptomyces]MCP9944265.1 DUF397 domain-containing protein [Streptomyces somaliensis]MCP9962498.1 DUF397 domain-containing protein [Streptomyces somaliensis]MCP9975325.1 DUF397 domain-containing protein [Streptomyces somaliensis]URM90928.1 DUF397 domain-containing protein [Streptomyces sp. MRC013]
MNSTSTPQPLQWVKSTYSGGDGGQCLEWAPGHARATGEFLVRDSKNPDGPRLTLGRHAFTGLVELARLHG